MPKIIVLYVRGVEVVNRKVGRFAMYLIFVMIAALLYSSISRTIFDQPLIWAVETAQFLLAAYYLLGGAYSMQLDSHVRMDLFYGNWTPKQKSCADVLTILCLIFYLVILLAGGISSTQYALEYGQKNYSAWAPPLAPVKIMMSLGIFLMLLQAVAILFKDIAVVLGRKL